MNIFITGGCGFLGSNLAEAAIARGHGVTVFDNLYRTGASDNLAWLRDLPGFAFCHGDIRSAGDVNAAIQSVRPDAIFHLAGQVAMTTSIAHPRMDFEVNALGTLNILEAIRQFAPQTKVVYASTNKVYGDLEQFQYEETDTRYVCQDHPNGFDERTPLDFHSPYGCSKGAADQYMLDYARVYGLDTVVFRHSSMYGGRQYSTFDQGWIGWFCEKAMELKNGSATELFTISGNGKQVRDILHADDAVRLYFAAVEHIDQARGQAFNVGGGMGNSLSLLELFQLLDQRLGITLAYRKLPPRESDQRVFVADLNKCEQRLGWKPQVTLDEGLAKMLAWVGRKPA